MSNYIKGFNVVLEQDIHEDNAALIQAALLQIKGVVSVEPLVANIEDHMARERVRLEMGKQILDIVFPKKK